MPYQNVTLADLQVMLTQRWDSVVFWTAEEARLALNEALRDWNLLTGRWRRRLNMPTVAGQVEYDINATLLYGMRVKVGSNPGLTPTSILELDLGRPTWRLETTASGGDVPTIPMLWAPVSIQRIAIWPATMTLTDLFVDGVSNTPVLGEPADFIDVDEETLPILVDMALHCAAFKEAGPRWRSTKGYYLNFLRAAAEENGALKANQVYRRQAGLDRRRDLQKLDGVPTMLDELGSPE
jgi:hypothetical protein